MHVNDGHRRLLHDQIAAATSPHAAEVLMALLPPTGWADLATKQDLKNTETRLGARIDRLDGRIDGVETSLNARIDGVEASLGARIDGVDSKVESMAVKVSWRVFFANVTTAGLVFAAIAVFGGDGTPETVPTPTPSSTAAAAAVPVR